jgi:hypothetical protein
VQIFGGRSTTIQTTSQSAQSSSPYYFSNTWTYRFTAGALNGNYTEVGVGWANSTMFSRALITPDGVNPEAFPVQIDEQLDVSYQLRVYPPSESDWGAGVYNISGTNYDVFGRLSTATTTPNGTLEVGAFDAAPLNAGVTTGTYSGTVGPITGSPSGTQAAASTYAFATYSNNSYTRQATVTAGLTAGNVAGGIRAIRSHAQSLGYYVQYQFTPAIPKDSTKTLALTFQCTWARR